MMLCTQRHLVSLKKQVSVYQKPLRSFYWCRNEMQAFVLDSRRKDAHGITVWVLQGP